VERVLIRKSKLVEKLVEHWVNGKHLQRDLDGSHNSLLIHVLEHGFTGYWNMSDQELEKISRRVLKVDYEIVEYNTDRNHDEKNFRGGSDTVEIREMDRVRAEIDALKDKMEYYESLKSRLESLERSQEVSRQHREIRHTSVDERPHNWK